MTGKRVYIDLTDLGGQPPAAMLDDMARIADAHAQTAHSATQTAPKPPQASSPQPKPSKPAATRSGTRTRRRTNG